MKYDKIKIVDYMRVQKKCLVAELYDFCRDEMKIPTDAQISNIIKDLVARDYLERDAKYPRQLIRFKGLNNE